jgi:hypothetical protein
MIGFLVVFAVIMWLFLAGLALLVQAESQFDHQMNEGLDLSVNLSLTFEYEQHEPMPSVWRRLRNARVFRLPKRRRIQAHGRPLAQEL